MSISKKKSNDLSKLGVSEQHCTPKQESNNKQLAQVGTVDVILDSKFEQPEA